MLKKYLKYIFLILFLLGSIAFLVDKYAKHEYLNFLASYYFDEEYYLAEYPEVKNSGLPAYEHYKQIGWKENKNPNAEFDSKFYKCAYLTYGNKYELTPIAHYVYEKIKFRNNLTAPKKVILLENPKYYLSLVALFQNEARFLKEWIEFYRMIGVEHFYLYNHLSTDNYMEVLKPYIDQGIVELKQLTEPFENQKHFVAVQGRIYTEIAKQIEEISEWLMIVDIDEFMFPVKEFSLAETLKKYDKYASVSAAWRMFGSGDIQKIPDNKLLIETLLHKSKPTGELTLVKSIVKPRYVDKFIDPHYAMLDKGYHQITENFDYFQGSVVAPFSEKVFMLNHYWTRDLDFFYKNKINRIHLRAKDSSPEQIEKKKQDLLKANQNMSTTYDDAILKYVPELRKRLFGK